MKKIMVICVISIMMFGIIGCSKEESTSTSKELEKVVEKQQETESTMETSSSSTAVKSESSVEVKTENSGDVKPDKVAGLVKCGEAYNAGDLSFNVYGVDIEELGGDKMLMLNVEVFNNSSEDINFNPMMTMAVFNENGKECSWNMMIGKLSGIITPNNKIKGNVAYEITGIETDRYVLGVGDNFEHEDAISITSNDIGMTYPEVFEGSGVESDYTIGVPVTSEVFDMMITKASIIPSDKEGKEILLIDLSMKNNDSEPHIVAFEIDGVYTSEGEKLSTEVNEWTFTRFDIGSGVTETGIVSYYVPEGIRDFYMTVKPNVKDFNNSSNIVFSVE